jgi:hypothetical protein
MHFTLKEESYVVIENGSWKIKAGIGVTDTNQFPSVVCNFFLFFRTFRKLNKFVDW